MGHTTIGSTIGRNHREQIGTGRASLLPLFPPLKSPDGHVQGSVSMDEPLPDSIQD